MSVKLRTLNNYPEWKTKESIIGVAKYLETRTNDDPLYPSNIKSKQQRNRYTNKFGNGDFQVKKRTIHTKFTTNHLYKATKMSSA